MSPATAFNPNVKTTGPAEGRLGIVDAGIKQFMDQAILWIGMMIKSSFACRAQLTERRLDLSQYICFEKIRSQAPMESA